MVKALIFMLVLLVSLLSASALGDNTTPPASCDQIREQPNPCEFVREYCLDEKFLISYMEIYYCSWGNYPAAFFVFTTIWIVVLFYILYTIADNHFTVALQGLSNFFRLSPDMAGLTFLAFGNGAPDFFTSLAGVEDNTALILAGSVGSGLFITCFVLGFVIILASDPKSQDDVIKSGEDSKFSLPREVSAYSFIRNATLYLICLIFTLVICATKYVHFSVPILMIVIFLTYLFCSIGFHIYSNQKKKRKLSEEKFNSSSPLAAPSNHSLNKPKFSTLSFVHDVCGLSDKNIYQKIIFAVTLPVNLIVSLTIPPMDEEDFDPFISSSQFRKWLRLRLIINPFFSLLFILLIFEKVDVYINGVFPFYGLYLILAALISLFFFFTTRAVGVPKYFILQIVYGFVLCIVWMYAASNELVSALVSFGHIFGISRTILGVTVLAWGNSFGDLVADIATTKVGYFQTASTATYSGPIQNVLLTIGVTLLAVALKSPNKVFEFTDLTDDIFIGFSFLVFSFLVTTVMTVFVYKFQIPKYFGYILIGIYILYLPFAIMAGAGVFPGLLKK